MSFFNYIRLARIGFIIRNIHAGAYGKLSNFQITNWIVHLPAAKEKLSKNQYRQVLELYSKYKKDKKRKWLEAQEYHDICEDIISEFDKIAPIESYSGLSSTETYNFLQLIKEWENYDEDEDYCSDDEEDEDENECDCINDNSDKNLALEEDAQINESPLSTDEIAYVNTIMNDTQGRLDKDDTEKFVKILRLYPFNGKEKVLEAFDNFSDDILNKKGPMKSLIQVSIFVGILNSNGIISRDESNELSKKYAEKSYKHLKKEL